jgi:putative FmdB family regulatory protein
MPLYVFRCLNCGFEFQQQMPMADVSDPAKHPEHCGQRMQRVFTAANFIIMWDRSTYLEKAERGEEHVPGMTTDEVRRTVAGWRKAGRRKVHAA